MQPRLLASVWLSLALLPAMVCAGPTQAQAAEQPQDPTGDVGPRPGCPIGTTPTILFSDGFEDGGAGWMHSGTGDTWTRTSSNPHAGTFHLHASDPAVVTDQRLVSPPVWLPSTQNPLTLSFWHVPNLEPDDADGCHDGGILEVSIFGASWTQVPNANLLVGPYQGLVSSGSSNPLAGLNAWCGTTGYMHTVADISAYAGEAVQFRLRLGSNNSGANPGWDLDDVRVESCLPSCPTLAKGDFNQDSKADLLFQHTPSNRNMTWLMNGTVRTGANWIVPDPAPGQQIVGADDFDADGKSDLLFRHSTTGALEFWLMNGTTRVGAGVPIGGAATLALNWKLAATGDFNTDGRPDLVWRNSVSQKLVIWTMNGTTKTGALIPSPGQAAGPQWDLVGALDYNNDGNRDLLWHNSTSGKTVLWFMDASVVRIYGMFTIPDTAGPNIWEVVAGGDYGIGVGGEACSNDIVWRSFTSGSLVVHFMNFAGARTHGVFTDPYSPTTDPDGNPTVPADWLVVGPR